MSLKAISHNKVFPLLALDHRGSLKKLLKTQNDSDVIRWKEKVLEYLLPHTPAVLLDVNYGLTAYRHINMTKSYLLAIEKSGYQGNDEIGRKTKLKYTAKQLKELGAEAVKLLIYYNPYNKNSTHQNKIIKEVSLECEREKIPFLLEIVTYNNKGERKTKNDLVIDSLKKIMALGVKVDVYKLEFPGKVNQKKSASVCAEITKMLGKTPWILLSAGADYEVFKEEVKIATLNGAKGFLAGRALWQDFADYGDLENFLRKVAVKRLAEISSIAKRNVK